MPDGAALGVAVRGERAGGDFALEAGAECGEFAEAALVREGGRLSRTIWNAVPWCCPSLLGVIYDTMGLAETEEELADRASRFIKAELAKRLEGHGVKGETENSIKSKLKRGTFAATFLLATIATLELEGIRLDRSS